MPNRYSDFSDQESRTLGDGGDWFAQNDPALVMRQPNPGIPREQGGFTGNPSPSLPTGQTRNPDGTVTVQTATGPQTFPALPQPGTTLPHSETTWNAGQGWTGQSAVGGPEQFGGDYQKWFMSLVGNRPWNQQTLNALMPTLQQYGIKLTPANASGDQTKIQLPTGEWVRVGFGEGHPVWIPQTDRQGNSLFGPSAGAGGSYSGPGAIPPPFQAPNLAALQQEPGYQARMQMGMDALQRSAAAHGSLLSGGTQKALDRYAQDYASSEYGNAYNRALQTYNTNWQTQSVDPWQRYAQTAGMGLNAALGSKTPVNPFVS